MSIAAVRLSHVTIVNELHVITFMHLQVKARYAQWLECACVEGAQAADPTIHAALESPVQGTPVPAPSSGTGDVRSPRTQRLPHIADLLASKELLLACFSMARERTWGH